MLSAHGKSLIAVVFCLICLNSAWGLSSDKSPQQKAAQSQSQAAGEPRGTVQSPFSVKIIEPDQAEKETSRAASNRQPKRNNGWMSGWSLSDKIAAIASVAGSLQFIALLFTVGVMVLNGRRQLRAYVFPNDAGLWDGSMLDQPMPEHANEPGIILNFRNSGQTPAYKVVSWANMEVILRSEEDSLVAPERLEAFFSSNIGPGGIMPKSRWFGRPLSADEITAIETGTKAIYYYGRIEYVDAFRRKRFSNFRLFYGGKFPPAKGVVFNVCQRGNDAK